MIISDIDGCLFNNMHRKHLIPDNKELTDNWTPFSKACVADSALYEVINLVKHLHQGGNQEIVFLTSRAFSAYDETMKQLITYFSGLQFELFMRPMDDHRGTVEYKKSQLEYLSPRFKRDSILIDDHPGIIAMAASHFPALNRLLVPSFDCTVNHLTKRE